MWNPVRSGGVVCKSLLWSMRISDLVWKVPVNRKSLAAIWRSDIFQRSISRKRSAKHKSKVCAPLSQNMIYIDLSIFSKYTVAKHPSPQKQQIKTWHWGMYSWYTKYEAKYCRSVGVSPQWTDRHEWKSYLPSTKTKSQFTIEYYCLNVYWVIFIV